MGRPRNDEPVPDLETRQKDSERMKPLLAERLEEALKRMFKERQDNYDDWLRREKAYTNQKKPRRKKPIPQGKPKL